MIHKLKFLFVTITTLMISSQIKAQCEVTANAYPQKICPLDNVTLSANGGCSLPSYPTLSWQDINFINTIPIFTNPCGPGPNGSHLWISPTDSTPRIIEIKDINIPMKGCIIEWWMRYGRAQDTGTCHAPDWPNEGIHLQYSTDSGATWNNFPVPDQEPVGSTTPGPPFNTKTPGSGSYWQPYFSSQGQKNSELYYWNHYENRIPDAAVSNHTQFRFIQMFSSGKGYDTWGIDEAEIKCLTGNLNINWSHGPTVLNPPAVTLPPKGNSPYDTCFTVTVSDTIDSATDTVCITVNPVHTSDFTISDTSLCSGDSTTITYTGSATTSANYNWNFDDSAASGQGPHVRQFNSPGQKTVSLTVQEYGCKSLKTVKTVNVHPYPSVSFTPKPKETCFGDSISFTNQTTPSSSNWSWSFGDGSASSKKDPSHYYQSPGTYNVSLKATTKYGCADTLINYPVTIYPNPKAYIDYQWIESDEIIYSDVSTAGAPSYVLTGRQWSFGTAASPQTSQDSSVHVTYSSPGTYETKLIVDNDHGCSDTSSLKANITSNGKPETVTGIKIYPNPSEGIVNLEIPDAIDHNPQISVYDFRGKLIRKFRASDKKITKLDLSEVNSGNYLIVIKNQNFIVTRKIMLE